MRRIDSKATFFESGWNNQGSNSKVKYCSYTPPEYTALFKSNSKDFLYCAVCMGCLGTLRSCGFYRESDMTSINGGKVEITIREVHLWVSPPGSCPFLNNKARPVV